MAEWYGINYPFKGGVQNFLSKQVGIRIIKNDILQLLYTNPGERVYRPDYGVGITLYLFDQLDDSSISDLRSRIISQIGTYEPRVEIDRLNVIQDNDNNLVNILLVCNLIQGPDEQFEINLNLPILER